jgi:hypothetical protein
MIARAMVLIVVLVGAVGARADQIADLLVILREGQSDPRSEACDALGAMGPAARVAVRGLTEIGPLAVEAAPALLASVAAEEDSAARPPAREVLEALAEMGPGAMPALIDALANSSAGVRMTAVLALKHLGPAAKPALAGLRKIVRSEANETLKTAAADALRAIGSGE